MRFLACVLLIIATTHAEKLCEPDKVFKDYCNTCVCGPEGKAAMCTFIDCDLNVWNKDGSVKKPNEIFSNPVLREKREIKENEETCEPGSSFKNYCNSCFCGPEGKAARSMCTFMVCDHDVWNKDGTLKNPNSGNPLLRKAREIEDRCQPGKSFNYYCNSCLCGKDGVAACTAMACDTNLWNRDGSLKLPNEIANDPLMRGTRDTEIQCEPGKKFKYYCNSCACGTDGRAACTKMYCNPDVWNKDGSLKLPNEIANNPLLTETRDTEIQCEPGKKFKYYCNSCACGIDGTAVCTKMYCSPDVWNKDGSLKLPNEIANNPLLTETRDTEIHCEPGKKFKYYCNSCACGTDGRAACTKMYCYPNIWNEDGSLKLPNQIANNPLVKETRDTEIHCEPGKKFKYYCNSCTCGTDGRAACTNMYCNPDVWNKDGSLKLPNEIANNPLLRKQRSSEFLCQPGKLFMDDCNTCSCGKDGKTTACTLMLCPPRKDGRVPAPKVCEPKKHFNIECNQCICNEDGLKITCTQMACSPPPK